MRRREAAGGGGGGADTELKTKTPHVNVGKKTANRQTKKSDWSTLSSDPPKREVAARSIIRSMAQTLCYDLARAKKAKDGKKQTKKSDMAAPKENPKQIQQARQWPLEDGAVRESQEP